MNLNYKKNITYLKNQFVSGLGPIHRFNGRESDFYITQSSCGIGSAAADANYFCKSFYGSLFASTGYTSGTYSDSRSLGWQMHNRKCTSSGEDIDGTDCNGGKCKIWQRTSNYQGLYDIVCKKSSGNDFFF